MRYRVYQFETACYVSWQWPVCARSHEQTSSSSWTVRGQSATATMRVPTGPQSETSSTESLTSSTSAPTWSASALSDTERLRRASS